MGFWMRVWLIRAEKKKKGKGKEKGKEKGKGKKRKRKKEKDRYTDLIFLFSSLLFPTKKREQQQQKKEKEKENKKKTNLSPIIQQRNPRPRHTPSLIKSRRQFRINFQKSSLILVNRRENEHGGDGTDQRAIVGETDEEVIGEGVGGAGGVGEEGGEEGGEEEGFHFWGDSFFF